MNMVLFDFATNGLNEEFTMSFTPIKAQMCE